MKPNIAPSEFIERIAGAKVLKDVITALETTDIALDSPFSPLLSVLIKISLLVVTLIPPIQILLLLLFICFLGRPTH
jgi:hypothetical protein